MSRSDKDKKKLIQDRCQALLSEMLRDEDNKYCVDCDAKGPRWASWNLGVFLCIRCAGIHRNLGVHISRVKSVNLDWWAPEQVVSLQQMGNSRARAVYEANLPDSFRRPQTDNELEAFARAKYQHKKYIAREWVPPPTPKVNWDKEIEEEERLKKTKKVSKTAGGGGLGPLAAGGIGPLAAGREPAAPLPAPLPKPAPATHMPPTTTNPPSSDLLALDTPTSEGGGREDDFSSFLSADTGPTEAGKTVKTSSRTQEELDFFSTPMPGPPSGHPSGAAPGSTPHKLNKDSILALYGQAPAYPAPPAWPPLGVQAVPGVQGVPGIQGVPGSLPPNFMANSSNPFFKPF